MTSGTVTISRKEYERLKRTAESKAFLQELDRALQSSVQEAWSEVQPRKRARTRS